MGFLPGAIDWRRQIRIGRILTGGSGFLNPLGQNSYLLAGAQPKFGRFPPAGPVLPAGGGGILEFAPILGTHGGRICSVQFR